MADLPTKGTDIFGPFLAMMLLTFVVWVVMYVLRIRHMQRNQIHPQKLTTPERAVELMSEHAANAANNLKNLFELPVLFYMLCLYLYVTGAVDGIDVMLAWAFVAFRVAHSIVHCSFNLVLLRFWLYIGASVALWSMLLRAVFG
jgi:hypothetical protein